MIRPTTEQISAACAVFTVICGVPATAVSCAQAREASESSDRAADLLLRVERLARAAEANSRIARDSLVEQKILSGASRTMAQEAARSASASEDNATSSREQARVAIMQADIMDRSRRATIEAAQRQLAAAVNTAESGSRARLVLIGSQAFDLGADRKPGTQLSFANRGSTEESGIRSWANFVSQPPGGPVPTAPQCKAGTGWAGVGRLVNGRITVTYNDALKRANYEKFQKGEIDVIMYGAICYFDVYGKAHRTPWCSKLRPDGVEFNCSYEPSS